MEIKVVNLMGETPEDVSMTEFAAQLFRNQIKIMKQVGLSDGIPETEALIVRMEAVVARRKEREQKRSEESKQ